jgi:hypothetical protein
VGVSPSLRALLVGLAGALLAVSAATPAASQQSTDIIRGRVTGPPPDTLPIAGARITATSYQGNVSKTAQTDKNGRFQVIFVNGEGDYWIEVAKIGFNRRRFEIRKVGDEQVMLADARLTSAVVSLDAVTITADNRALVNRNSTGNDVSGGDKPLTSNSAQVSPGWTAKPICSRRSGCPATRTTRRSTDSARASARFRPTRRCASRSASSRPMRRAEDSPARRSAFSRFPDRTSLSAG